MSLNNEPRPEKELRKYNIYSKRTIEQHTVKKKKYIRSCRARTPEFHRRISYFFCRRKFAEKFSLNTHFAYFWWKENKGFSRF